MPSARPNISALLKQLESDQAVIAPPAEPQGFALAPAVDERPRHSSAPAAPHVPVQAAPVEPVVAQLAPEVDEYAVSALVTSGGDDVAVPVRVNDVLIRPRARGLRHPPHLRRPPHRAPVR